MKMKSFYSSRFLALLPPSTSVASTSTSGTRAPFCTTHRPKEGRSTRASTNATRGGRSAAGSYDVVLSSGFLAFAHHSGFLQAVEDAGLGVAGVMGTSAGALAGSLYCAGYSPRQVASELSRNPPIKYLSPSPQPWEGLLTFDGVVGRLRELLPDTFEELEREFAVGVVDTKGRYMVVDSGPLPEAVAASAAIPVLFRSVQIPGLGRQNPFKDGGIVDRVGLKGWRDRRRGQLRAGKIKRVPSCLVHVIQRSSRFSGADDVDAVGERDVTTVYSPKSGVSLLNLGDFEEAWEASIQRAKPEMMKLKNEASGLERFRRLWEGWSLAGSCN